jgi:uncharacterized protein YcfJ
MHASLRNVLTLATLAAAAQVATAQISFYEHPGFEGRSFTTQKQVANFERFGFNDRASSAVVSSERWEVCEHQNYGGRCVVLRKGNYPDLRAMGLDDRVSSVHTVSANEHVADSRWAPPPVTVYDARRRGKERLYEAQVVNVRAVVGSPEQRCWVEHEQVQQDRDGPNVGGAVAGALIGGILGHQIGGGTGRNLATAGGVVAGAALGANVGRDGRSAATQNVRRCETTPSQARPEFWDVTYNFRGQDHRVQRTHHHSEPTGRAPRLALAAAMAMAAFGFGQT